MRERALDDHLQGVDVVSTQEGLLHDVEGFCVDSPDFRYYVTTATLDSPLLIIPDLGFFEVSWSAAVIPRRPGDHRSFSSLGQSDMPYEEERKVMLVSTKGEAVDILDTFENGELDRAIASFYEGDVVRSPAWLLKISRKNHLAQNR